MRDFTPILGIAIVAIICFVFLAAIGKEQIKHYNIEVVYSSNGNIDTLQYEIKTIKRHLDNCKIYLDGDIGCLRSYDGGLFYETFACGVRSFKILSTETNINK